MILIFNVTDPNGVERRLSAVCAPSTTAAGAINLFRTRVGVPNTVKVELQLENHIPIRHQTAPLTSLRKQRGGVAHVLQINLWVLLSGPSEAMASVDLTKIEVAREEEEEDAVEPVAGMGAEDSAGTAEEALEEMGPSWTARGERKFVYPAVGHVQTQPGVPSGGAAPRIIKERSPSAAGRADGENETVTMPLTARRAAPAVSVRIARPGPLTARGPCPTSSSLYSSGASPAVAAAARRSSLSPSGTGTVAPGERIRKSNPHATGVTKGSVAPVTASVQTEPKEPVETAPDPERPAYQPPPLSERGHTVRRDCKLAQIMIREYPKLLDPSDTKQVVAVVKEDDRLRAMSFDPELQVSSALDGVSDADYSRYLSTGLVHGIEVRTGTLGHRIALYGAMNSLKHSCRPNATVHLDFFTQPNSASCRCAVVEGLKKGDEITYLYRHADSQAFMLLSRERRQNLLKKRYFFDCQCVRCDAALRQRRGKNASSQKASESDSKEKEETDDTFCNKVVTSSPPMPQSSIDAEASLTGCFFTDSSYDTDPEKQAAISAEMKSDYDALQIMSDDGLDITLTVPGNVPPTVRTKQLNKLLHFLRKYASAESVLRLHEHHWRVNLVRLAYIQETVRLCAMKGVTPEARRREPESKKLFTPTRTVYDLCLKQLAVEGLFIPAGNPHRLTTYESFQYLVSILPPTLAGAVMKQANTATRVNWRELQETKEAWGLLKRLNAAPAVVATASKASAAATGTVASSHPSPAAHPSSAPSPSQPVRRYVNPSRVATTASPPPVTPSNQPPIVSTPLIKRPVARAAVEKGPTAKK